MSQRRSTSIILTILIALICLSVADAQSRRRRTPTVKPRQDAAQPSAPPQPIPDSFLDAQRNIEAAIQQLELYLRKSPDGERAATARRQVEALKGLSVSAALPEWVKMGSKYRQHIPIWRIASVVPRPDKVSLDVQIACERADGADCNFDPFDRSPLVLIDSAGHYYPMLKAGDLPPDVRLNRDGAAAISGGRTITVQVDFAPLSAGAASGQVYYRDNNRAEPARFSLDRRR